MAAYVLDIETDGLLDVVKRVHCLVLKNLETGEVTSVHGHPVIKACLDEITAQDTVIGHNVLGFDLIALEKVLGWTFGGKVYDTLILSKLIWPDLFWDDVTSRRPGAPLRWPGMPAKMRGRHGLEAWGWRLGLNKGDYKKEMEAKGIDPWAEWNPEMQAYCELDVEVTAKLWSWCRKHRRWPHDWCLEIEHEFKRLMMQQEAWGVRLDEAKAAKLYVELVQKRDEILARLRQAFPSRWRAGAVAEPSRTVTYSDPTRPSPTAGAPYTKVEWWEFDPAKAAHIVTALTEKHGWKPKARTKAGDVKTDEDTLATLPYPEIDDICTVGLLNKRIGTLAHGAQALLVNCKNGRIHGSIDPGGTKTRRCSHSKPNINIPKVRTAKGPDGKDHPALGLEGGYGFEFRDLFIADEGMVLVGADAAGIQLRGLAHYLAPYDKGAYIKAVTEGDVHETNRAAWETASRNGSKTLTYSFLFGCFPAKTGNIIIDDYRKAGLPVPKGTPGQVGEKHRRAFEGTLKMDRMLDDMWAAACKRGGYFCSLDGSFVPVSERRLILSAALQSFEAALMKRAIVLLCRDLSTRGWIAGEDYRLALNVHDEEQTNVKENLAGEFGTAFIDNLRQAGKDLRCRCPLDGDFKIGRSWAETH